MFIHRGSRWMQAAELTASDGARRYMFGASVAISDNGGVILVGSPVYNGNRGAVYVFTRTGLGWVQTVKLTAPAPVAGDTFGTSVALSADGRTALVGSPEHGAGPGAAYVFNRGPHGWTQTARLTAADGMANDFLGDSVALSPDGHTAVAGAVGRSSAAGAAFLFTRTGKHWSRAAELTASDSTGNGDNFGNAVATAEGGRIVVVAALGHLETAGTVYVFSRRPDGWTQTGELTASDGQPGDDLGASVSVSALGQTLIAGAPGHGAEGATYVFTSQRQGWVQSGELIPADGSGDDSGWAAGLTSDGRTALAGAPGDDSSAGRAVVFTGLPPGSSQ